MSDYLKDNLSDCNYERGDIYKPLIDEYKDKCRETFMSDEMVLELMNKLFYKSFDNMYPDDSVLPSQVALQKMIDVYEDYMKNRL